MSLSADRLFDRMQLKAQVNKWRVLAIVLAVTLGCVLIAKSANVAAQTENYIARVSVEGIILEDPERDQKLAELKMDKHVKAVIVYINSPGGTMVGGEALYKALRDVAETKPVVAVMGSIAASGGYMAALAADQLFAYAGTLTGSIGVLMQSAEVTGLAEKMGVNFITFKSAPLKGSPSPFEKITPQVSAAVDSGIQDSYAYFKDMVKGRRPLTDQELEKVADGRVFTGRQALEHKLVDALGGETEAVQWLVDNQHIKAKLPVKEYSLEEKESVFEELFSKVMGNKSPLAGVMPGSGILALWRP